MANFAVKSAVVVLNSEKKIRPKKGKKAFQQLQNRMERTRSAAEIKLAAADNNKSVKEALLDIKTLETGDQVFLQVKEGDSGAEKLLKATKSPKGKIQVKEIQASDIAGKSYVAPDGSLKKAQTSHKLAKTLRLKEFGLLGQLRKTLNDLKDKLGEGDPIKKTMEKIEDLIKRHLKGRKVKAKHKKNVAEKVDDLLKKPKDAEEAFKTLDELHTALKSWA